MKSLILLMAVVLVGCVSGPGEESQPDSNATAKPNAPTTTSWVSDPSDPNNVKIEAAIRKAAKKPTGELTKADLEKVTGLTITNNNLTDVNGLEKLTQLKSLRLQNNPNLTKAQIDELKKALPKYKIESNPTK